MERISSCMAMDRNSSRSTLAMGVRSRALVLPTETLGP